ncbi:unnamed protein product [Gongylonema pulchrum]|uniref:Charged multivesicular body protein 4a n=1 Tax=Gongylonema pulchrum TaxID=637853 RepID=A0A183DY90_9BILA|nr:unnamed protein product [Gongylonema pulchrum]
MCIFVVTQKFWKTPAMSVFGKIFGGGKKTQAPPATPQESIQKLRETEEMLVKKQEFLEKKIEAIFFSAMSVFGKIFGGGKKTQAPPATPQESIQKLRETEEMLVKKQEFLEKKIEAKQFEKQLQHIDGVLSTIEFQREALENASTNAEVLQVMGSAAKALKTAHNDMDVDQVHDLMEDIAEQQEVANEIAEAISNPVGFGQDVDEDELLKELEELEQVHDLMEDIAEQQEVANEIAEAISNPVGFGQDVDEDELLKELEELEQVSFFQIFLFLLIQNFIFAQLTWNIYQNCKGNRKKAEHGTIVISRTEPPFFAVKYQSKGTQTTRLYIRTRRAKSVSCLPSV